jgi:DNA primase
LPIGWKELSALKSAAVFGIKDALRRRADPWKDIATAAAQVLPVGANHTKNRSASAIRPLSRLISRRS